jgi:hypothetical protein
LAKKTRNSAVQNEFKLDRRTFYLAATAVLMQAGAGAVAGKADAPRPILSAPKIVGPIPVSDGNVPYTSTVAPGSSSAPLDERVQLCRRGILPVRPRQYLWAGNSGLDVQKLKPLGGLLQAEMPYATRLLMIRPRDNGRFSGRVHAYPFHNVSTRVSVERNLLRGGDAVLGFEACSGNIPRWNFNVQSEFDQPINSAVRGSVRRVIFSFRPRQPLRSRNPNRHRELDCPDGTHASRDALRQTV